MSEFKHGLSNTDIYHVWEAMVQRCTNPKNDRYNDYGGRGIEIIHEWRDPVNFINWALHNGYKKGVMLDRIDNDKGYYPDNCRFVNGHISQLNRRKSPDFGIELLPGGKYRVRVWKSNKCKHLGCYFTKEEAIAVRDNYLINEIS